MANVLEEYEEAMKMVSVVDRASFNIEWSKKRQDVMREYYANKERTNIIEHVLTNALETEISDKDGKTITLAEKIILDAINNETNLGLTTLKTVEKLYKLTGGGKQQIVVQGEFTLSDKARSLSK